MHCIKNNNSHVSNVSRNNDTTMTLQYINLMIDKQNLILHKFDNLNSLLNKTVEENYNLKEHIEALEDRTKTISKNIENLYKFFTDDDECDDECDDDCDDECDDCDCDDKDKNNESEKDEKDEIKNKKSSGLFVIPNSKNKKKNNGEVLIKVNGNPNMMQGNSSQINPLELLLEHLGGNQKKQEEVLSDSDEEYDNTIPIYDELQEEDKTNSNITELNMEIKTIDDLIKIGSRFEHILEKSKKSKKNKKDVKNEEIDLNNDGLFELDGKKYAINLGILCKLKNPLKRLSNMIGMTKVKNDVFEMILYYLQNFEKCNKNMMHSVIEGSPGVGKTKLGKILAQIYCALGIIPSTRFKYVKATDLMGDHVGATKHMTQKVIDGADGGVLFIDEAYALGSNDTKDPYGKECLDTLNFNLSENKKKLIVIIAGYADQLDKCFFSYNPGLERRFPFRYKIDSYLPTELCEMFIDKLRRHNWKLSNSVTKDKLIMFFKENKDEFPHFGGDIENLFKKCQFAHSKRVIGKHPKIRRKLDFDDINKGFEKFKDHKKEDKSKPLYPQMYI